MKESNLLDKRIKRQILTVVLELMQSRDVECLTCLTITLEIMTYILINLSSRKLSQPHF